MGWGGVGWGGAKREAQLMLGIAGGDIAGDDITGVIRGGGVAGAEVL